MCCYKPTLYLIISKTILIFLLINKYNLGISYFEDLRGAEAQPLIINAMVCRSHLGKMDFYLTLGFQGSCGFLRQLCYVRELNFKTHPCLGGERPHTNLLSNFYLNSRQYILSSGLNTASCHIRLVKLINIPVAKALNHYRHCFFEISFYVFRVQIP